MELMAIAHNVLLASARKVTRKLALALNLLLHSVVSVAVRAVAMEVKVVALAVKAAVDLDAEDQDLREPVEALDVVVTAVGTEGKVLHLEPVVLVDLAEVVLVLLLVLKYLIVT